MYLLRDLAEQVERATISDPLGRLTTGDIYKLLDVRGVLNEHLANPLNRDPNVFYNRPRAVPLTGLEPVYGEYLTIEYVGHDSFVRLLTFNNLEEVAANILSVSGILNPFTTFLIAFVRGQHLTFDIVYQPLGSPPILFDKDKTQMKLAPALEFPHTTLIWRS